jgi:hypothetical protein
MTLLDAQEIDPEKVRKQRKRIIFASLLVIIVLAVGVLGFLLGHGWWFQYWPDERKVGHFFEALQKQDFKTAYAIWMNDPNWPEHPSEHANYLFNEFYRDWGPSGQWGVIKTAKVNGASPCPPPPSSGILVDVIVNDRVEHAQVWVEKSNHTLGYPPCNLIFH